MNYTFVHLLILQPLRLSYNIYNVNTYLYMLTLFWYIEFYKQYTRFIALFYVLFISTEWFLIAADLR